MTVAQVLQQLSDDEYFDDVDSDRDSLYQPDDVEPGDGDSTDSGETEVYDYDVAAIDSDSDTDAGAVTPFCSTGKLEEVVATSDFEPR